MAASRKPLYPNPFYVLLIVVSAAFVLTTFGWLITPMVQRKAANLAPGADAPGAGALAVAAWLDRWSVTALAIELILIVVTAFLLMASDRWFPKEGQGDGKE